MLPTGHAGFQPVSSNDVLPRALCAIVSGFGSKSVCGALLDRGENADFEPSLGDPAEFLISFAARQGAAVIGKPWRRIKLTTGGNPTARPSVRLIKFQNKP
jgi:hypothetical protein